jgi:hypothetical protein
LRCLTEEQLTFFHTCVLRAYRTPDAIEVLYQQFPKARRYALKTFYEYLRSEDGVARSREVLATIRERAVDLSLAHHGGRIDLLVEMAERLVRKLRKSYGETADITDVPLPAAEIVSLNAELRQTLGALRAETEPFGPMGGDADFLSPVEAFWVRLQGGSQGLPGPLKRLIAEELPAVGVPRDVTPEEEPS